jgi:hypothetical protein
MANPDSFIQLKCAKRGKITCKVRLLSGEYESFIIGVKIKYKL